DVDGRESAPRVALQNAGSPPAAVEWTADSRSLERRGDGTPSPDRTRVALVRPATSARPGAGPSELWVRTVADGRETRVAAHDGSIAAVSWSPDAAYLAYVAGSRTVRHEQTPDYSGVKIIYTIAENVPGQLMTVAAAGGAPNPVGPGAGVFGN